MGRPVPGQPSITAWECYDLTHCEDLVLPCAVGQGQDTSYPVFRYRQDNTVSISAESEAPVQTVTFCIFQKVACSDGKVSEMISVYTENAAVPDAGPQVGGVDMKAAAIVQLRNYLHVNGDQSVSNTPHSGFKTYRF